MQTPLQRARTSALEAMKRTRPPRAWALYVVLPILLVGAVGTLIGLNYAVRHLWGEVIYAVAVTTGALWALGHARPARWFLERLDIPGFSVKRAFLWAFYALVALPVAVTYRPWGLVVLFSGVLIWIAAWSLRRFTGRPSKTPPPWVGALGGVLALAAYVAVLPRLALADRAPAAAPAAAEEVQEEAALANSVRPLLFFDDSERRLPLDIDEAVMAKKVRTCRSALGGDDCATVESPDSVDVGADYIDVADVTSVRGGDEQSAYYYRVTSGPSRVYVDFWWYFTLNPTPVAASVFCTPGFKLPGLTCHEHPSDWEGVTVVLGPCDRFGPACVDFDGRRWAPAAVRYAQHEFIVSYAWRPTLTRAWSGIANRPRLRPAVFVAVNSHASYPTACRRACKQIRVIAGRRISESRHDGRQPWVWNQSCDGCLHRLPLTTDGEPARWNAFTGRWGTQECILAGAYCSTGRAPGAPSRQKRYEDPGRAGPWLCPAPSGASACPRSADPDNSIPGFDASART